MFVVFLFVVVVLFISQNIDRIDIFTLNQEQIGALRNLIEEGTRVLVLFEQQKEKLDEKVTSKMDDVSKKQIIGDIIKHGKINIDNNNKLDELVHSLSDTYGIDSNGLKNMQVLKPKASLPLGKLKQLFTFGTTETFVKNNQYLTPTQIKTLQSIAKS